MVLSTLILGVALVMGNDDSFAELDFAEESKDDFLDSDLTDSAEVVLGAPRDYPDRNFQRFATCSGTRNRQHTRAQGTYQFQNSCADVSAEITARANGANGWRDPHNRGHYTVLDVQDNYIKLKRRTGNNRYTDVITFGLTANGAGCTANACSVSQSNSNNDAGTNMCNMGNLVCGSKTKNYQNGVACKVEKTDLQYTISNFECGRYRTDGQYRAHNCQRFTTTCLRQRSLEESAPAPLLEGTMEVVLAAPRDYPNPNFQRFATCTGTRNRQHTRAQGTYQFTNSCADVAAEIVARASGANGWRDPHNRGHYAVLDSEANYIKLKRRTGNNRYTDLITFGLTANGAGCTANACSVSQANSNNDGGTNMCNMGNLVCGSKTRNYQNGVACKVEKTDLQYTISNFECGRYRTDGQYRAHNCQRFTTTCLRQRSSLTLEYDEEVDAEELVAPKIE